MRGKHAIHNEKACDYLLKTGEFNDWVITTAFYSALHYVQSELFPLTEDGKTYDNFNIYFWKILNKQNKKLSKHNATIQLVNARLKPASSYYRWLYDTCMTTRYKNYVVSDEKAKKARKYLTELKNNLNKS